MTKTSAGTGGDVDVVVEATPETAATLRQPLILRLGASCR